MIFLFNEFSHSSFIHSLKDPSLGSENLSFVNGTLTLNFPCENTIHCTPYVLILPRGVYKIELWGAEGGFSLSSGGLGGYASGILSLSQQTRFYAYIGGIGSYSSIIGRTLGGFNGGGGDGYYQGSQYGGGGGGSDLRVNSDSLYHRIIVGGGGGGGGLSSRSGGYGGGLSGGNGISNPDEDPKYKCLNEGGFYDRPGRRHDESAARSPLFQIDAGFGFGGYFTDSYDPGWASGGGGGGWYGGSCGCVFSSSGAGGSGYVFTSGSHRPSGYYVSDEYELSEPVLHPGSDISYGHSGNGIMKIHFIESEFKIFNLHPSCHYYHPNYFSIFSICQFILLPIHK